jgi:U3 small nucleolar RNA-associated protein 14
LRPSEDPESSTTPVNGKGASTTKKKKSTKGMVDVEGAADILDSGGLDVGHPSSSQSDTKNEPDTDKKITMLSQEELVRRAFATQTNKDIEEEFQKEKEAMFLENDPTRKVADAKDSKDVAGWGSWTGAGAPPPLRPRKLPKKLEPPKKKKEDESRKRKDEGKPGVIVNQKRLKKMANNYMLGDVPHPYASRAEYEQAMLGGVGREWNVTSSFKSMTRPEILTRSGKIIQPISKKAKVARAPAKF